MSPNYAHQQHAPLHFLLWALAAWMLAMAWGLRAEPPPWVAPLLIGVALLMVFFALSFRELRTWVDEDHLNLAFGPLPLFRKRVPLASIRSAQAARSSWIDGWGIHWLPGRGEIWNLWGFDCVELDLDGRRLRIGTDDPEGLAGILARAASDG